MNNSAAHSKLVNQLLVELSKIDGCKVWKQHSGKFKTLYDSFISIGVDGWSDIGGIIMCQSGKGITLQIEVKTGTGKLDDRQRAWRNMIISHGGCHIIARERLKTIANVMEYMKNN